MVYIVGKFNAMLLIRHGDRRTFKKHGIALLSFMKREATNCTMCSVHGIILVF